MKRNKRYGKFFDRQRNSSREKGQDKNSKENSSHRRRKKIDFFLLIFKE